RRGAQLLQLPGQLSAVLDSRALEAPRPLIRAFFGIPLPEPSRRLLGEYLAACAEREPGFRWVRADNLHLTLRFLGSVEAATLDHLESSLQDVSTPPLELELDGLGSFGTGRLKRVLWLGLAAG